MNLFDSLEDSAIESGSPAWVQIGSQMLVVGWIGDVLAWMLDGEVIHPDEARKIVQTYT
ncbi:hypothetical protein [Paraburkholderia sediminicola]|uniref:hypothetical protein n=1 Tax=Paraburkholderia sediminicola TaxID=458836 RepID=UPI0038BB061F